MKITNREEAETYARNIHRINGHKHLVFKLRWPNPMGWKWATCLVSQREDYRRLADDGVFYEVEYPATSSA